MKQKLLQVIADARVKERELVSAATDTPADADGSWHVKDHLAHAAWWRDRDGLLIEAVRTGSPPPPAVGSREEGTQEAEEDRQNAVIYEIFRDKPLAEIRDFASSSWDRFEDAVEACTEEDLSRSHPYAPNERIWQTVTGIPYHTGEHLTYVYQDSGDDSRLEATHRWLRDIYAAVAPDARHRANADYNLACFYAKRGRVEEALPLLRDSLEGNDQLREWAGKDSDLDAIRADLAVRELLAT